MSLNEIQEFCMEKNLLLENSLLQRFSSLENFSLLKILLEKLKQISGKSFITFNLFEENKKELEFFAKEFGFEESFNKINLCNLFQELSEEKISRGENKNLVENFDESKIKILSSQKILGKTVGVRDFVNHFRNRYSEFKSILEEQSGLENLISIGNISEEKQKCSIIGMIYDKKITKNKNLILEIEDLTGKIKVLINCGKEELFSKAEDISLDSVVGFKGIGSKGIFFANEIFLPEAVLPLRKKSEIEEYILFIGDLHYGSKNFLEKDFLKFVDYLNKDFSEGVDVSKIKYLFIVGDLITGIGNYPGQESDLVIGDLEEQFKGIANVLSKIRKDIKIIISPGNHDCVRIMEPQPLFDEKYAWPLYELENVIITGNPSFLNLGESKNFEGFKVLTYHGFSFPYYANNIPSLMTEKTMNSPEKIMKYLLSNRHLAPTHASTQYFPSEKDEFLIRRIPDIFVSGHTHKSGVSYFNNILLVSSSSWEGKTAYQEKFGNEPDHCKVIAFNTKTREIKILDFESNPEENKKVGGER